MCWSDSSPRTASTPITSSRSSPHSPFASSSCISNVALLTTRLSLRNLLSPPCSGASSVVSPTTTNPVPPQTPSNDITSAQKAPHCTMSPSEPNRYSARASSTTSTASPLLLRSNGSATSHRLSVGRKPPRWLPSLCVSVSSHSSAISGRTTIRQSYSQFVALPLPGTRPLVCVFIPVRSGA